VKTLQKYAAGWWRGSYMCLRKGRLASLERLGCLRAPIKQKIGCEMSLSEAYKRVRERDACTPHAMTVECAVSEDVHGMMAVQT
jgi:hypothetical protein